MRLRRIPSLERSHFKRDRSGADVGRERFEPGAQLGGSDYWFAADVLDGNIPAFNEPLKGSDGDATELEAS